MPSFISLLFAVVKDANNCLFCGALYGEDARGMVATLAGIKSGPQGFLIKRR